MAIPEGLQDTMSRQAQAERERQARVILGAAEVLSDFIREAAEAAQLYAEAKGAQFQVDVADANIQVAGNRALLLAALGNLLQNAFKFTRSGTLVTLSTRAGEHEVDVEVADHCGGLKGGAEDGLFRPFAQSGTNRSGLGFGLSIALRSVEAQGGQLRVRNLPGVGCIFTMRLPIAHVPMGVVEAARKRDAKSCSRHAPRGQVAMVAPPDSSIKNVHRTRLRPRLLGGDFFATNGLAATILALRGDLSVRRALRHLGG